MMSRRRRIGRGIPQQAVPQRRAADRPLTQALARRAYERPRSFCDQLPWLEYLPAPDARCFLLDDGRSVGAVLDIVPVPTEGRSKAYLAQVRDGIEAALQDAFEEHDEQAGPWVVQFYCYDDSDLDGHVTRVRDYVRPAARGSAFTEAFLATLHRHWRSASQPRGLFTDRMTGTSWRATRRRTHIVVYRRWPAGYRHPAGLMPVAELNEALDRFSAALVNAGVGVARMGGCAFYAWLLRWFNPRPMLTGGNPRTLQRLAVYPGETALPFGHDFAESLLFSWPRTDLASQTWWFDGLPHRCITTQRLRRVPAVGHCTGERVLGDAVSALMDQLPPATVLALTVLIVSQDGLENQLQRLDARAVGETAESLQTRRDVATAKSLLASGHKLFKSTLMFYLRGEDLADLTRRSNALSSLLLSQHLQPVRDAQAQCALDAYLLGLPMAYDPLLDRHTQFARFTYAQHIANLAPVYGRSEGTGNPGFSFFNRGGAPLCFDPLSLADRKKNAHLLLLGPTGAGKSATLVSLICQVLALVRPRLFIIEAGNSFGLLADYCREQGLSVHRVTFKPGAGVAIPPFADAHLLLGRPLQLEAGLDVPVLAGDDAEGDEQRDLLGELELTALLMITGGEEREAAKFDRADRRLLRDAIVAAAELTAHERRQTLTEDVAAALEQRAGDTSLPAARRDRLHDMAACLRLFCDGFEGELFNREGALWPEADVTLIDLATYAREGYGAQLAVAYTSIMNRINNLAERYQHDERPLLMITDEGHIITTNPLLAPYVVKVVKMWRKLGAWYWVATQNLEDFPDAAKKLLNMIEWWLLLVMPKEEVQAVARFRALTPEQEQLLLSARKEPGCYTEGVVLSAQLEALFRVVPPPLHLALAMTEKDEKVARRRLMAEHGLTEVEAAQRMAQAIEQRRQGGGSDDA